jgi:hypothetical protein
MSKTVNELWLGPFRSVIIQPFGDLRMVLFQRLAKCLWVLISIFTDDFTCRKVLSMEDMLQVT